MRGRSGADLPGVAVQPSSGAELVTELRGVHAASTLYWNGYPTPEFFRRPASDVWAPVDQVRHLTKVMRAVTRGLRLPRLAVALLFGRARRPSRSYSALLDDYEAVLTRGGRAGRFAPAPLPASEYTPDVREQVMRYHAEAVDSFCAALARWPEPALDRYRLPHPLLGKLTLRELGFFTLFHNVHHVHVAERRRVRPREQ
jgi:hypothetical protein